GDHDEHVNRDHQFHHDDRGTIIRSAGNPQGFPVPTTNLFDDHKHETTSVHDDGTWSSSSGSGGHDFDSSSESTEDMHQEGTGPNRRYDYRTHSQYQSDGHSHSSSPGFSMNEHRWGQEVRDGVFSNMTGVVIGYIEVTGLTGYTLTVT